MAAILNLRKMVNAEAHISVPLDRTGRLYRSGRQDLVVGLRKRLHWYGVFLGLRFVAIRACRPEVCRLFDQGQQH